MNLSAYVVLNRKKALKLIFFFTFWTRQMESFCDRKLSGGCSLYPLDPHSLQSLVIKKSYSKPEKNWSWVKLTALPLVRMQSDNHDVPHSPEWNSHLPQPIRHICLPARALVSTECAFNRHRFLPPKQYHQKKTKCSQKRKRATTGEEINERKAPQNQSTMQEANDTMNLSELARFSS
jgi:hypothetical protein